jgi:hypothetical protein
MRLINSEDVKALINSWDSLPWEEQVDELIDRIPTAFDVDKVIANLEAQAERQLQRGIQENESACLYASSCYSVAVDVIKAGGIDV